MKLLIDSQASTVQPLKFEVWEWICNFTQYFTGYVITYHYLSIPI